MKTTKFLKNFLINFCILLHISNLKRFRKLAGGEWLYNRYMFDLGREMLCVWEKTDYNTNSGFTCTLKKETY